MKSGILTALVTASVFSFFLTACSLVSVRDTLYLGDVNIDAPVSVPPSHISLDKNAGDLTLSPRLQYSKFDLKSFATYDKYKLPVTLKDNSVYITKTDNLEWNVAEMNFGMDLDYQISKKFSLFSGVNLSNAGSRSLLGGNLGIGLSERYENLFCRWDFGLSFSSSNYDAITIVQRTETYSNSEKSYSFLLRNQGSVGHCNFFTDLSLCSAAGKELNCYLTAGYFTQSLLDYKPEGEGLGFLFVTVTYEQTDLRPECNLGFLYFSPGIIYELSEKVRLNLSLKVIKEVLLGRPQFSWSVFPVVQFDLGL